MSDMVRFSIFTAGQKHVRLSQAAALYELRAGLEKDGGKHPGGLETLQFAGLGGCWVRGAEKLLLNSVL